jgi:hypothetical protein
MKNSPRRGLLVLLATAALWTVAGPGRAVGRDVTRDFATVGSIVVRRVDKRTVIVIPVKGPLQAKLSEPFRVGNRWRLYLTFTNARMSIRGAKINRPEGVLAIDASELSNDVRLTVDLKLLGDYGARRSEEGMILWVDDESKPVSRVGGTIADDLAAAALPVAAAAGGKPAEPVTQASDSGGGGFVRIVLLVALAAVGGVVIQRVRRDGLPEWAQAAEPRLRRVLGLKAAQESAAVSPTRVTGRAPVIDPRGRSAEIGDAFRVEPDRPPSGIAALANPGDDRNDD